MAVLLVHSHVEHPEPLSVVQPSREDTGEVVVEGEAVDPPSQHVESWEVPECLTGRKLSCPSHNSAMCRAHRG